MEHQIGWHAYYQRLAVLFDQFCSCSVNTCMVWTYVTYDVIALYNTITYNLTAIDLCVVISCGEVILLRRQSVV